MSQLCQRLSYLCLLFSVGFMLCFIPTVLPIWSISTQVVGIPTANQNVIVAATGPVVKAIKSYDAGRYTEAIALWLTALAQASDTKQQAVIHANLAQAYRQIGQLDQAILHWEQAVDIYQADDNKANRQLRAQLLTEQAQAYSTLGQHRRAVQLAQSAMELARRVQDQTTVAAALGVLGNANWALGNYDSAIASHQASLKIAETLQSPRYIATAWGNLGNVLTSRLKRYQYQANVARLEGDEQQEERLTKLVTQDLVAAQAAYESSVQESKILGGMAEARALLNLNRLLTQSPATPLDAIDKNYQRVLALLEAQPDSRSKVYALVNLAVSYQEQGAKTEGVRGAETKERKTKVLLEEAIIVAKTIGDSRAESFALGTLGEMYERAGNYAKAMELTRQAQFMAQQIGAGDSLYRWQWQAGRLLKATGESEQAIASYKQAIITLQSIRSDILAASKDLQFDIRDSVEPVYRELIGLLVDNNFDSSNLSEALNLLELLKLSELQNFFGDECVQVALEKVNSEQIAKVNVPNQQIARNKTLIEEAVASNLKSRPNLNVGDPTAVVVYSIVLKNQTVMVLRFPNGSLKSYPITIESERLQNEINQLRFTLENVATEEYLSQSQKIYDLLIHPMNADLAAAKPSTVVFINDGVLRNVPMAALHDGQQFLVQKYPIATTLSLSLTNRKYTKEHDLRALIFGLSLERPPFASLPNVDNETAQVQRIIGGTRLLDRDFTLSNLETKLRKDSYSIVHLATHGRFGVDGASTYLLTADNRITLDEVESVLRQSKQTVDLLTLSACETAAGDNRSALGIAGVAIRAGVQSSLATLWFINDANTVPLIEEFYTQLRQPGITKAEALRAAQLKMIANPDFNHPAIWSPLILIGNWT